MTGARERWIPEAEYRAILARVPILCVDLLPRQAGAGLFGLVRRDTDGPSPGWCLVGGAVLRDEPLADAVHRHLGATLPDISISPGSLAFGGIVEYFTKPGIGQFVDSRKHAVSVTYVAECTGGTRVAGEAREFRWFRRQALDELSFGFGQDRIVRRLIEPELTSLLTSDIAIRTSVGFPDVPACQAMIRAVESLESWLRKDDFGGAKNPERVKEKLRDWADHHVDEVTLLVALKTQASSNELASTVAQHATELADKMFGQIRSVINDAEDRY